MTRRYPVLSTMAVKWIGQSRHGPVRDNALPRPTLNLLATQSSLAEEDLRSIGSAGPPLTDAISAFSALVDAADLAVFEGDAEFAGEDGGG